MPTAPQSISYPEVPTVGGLRESGLGCCDFGPGACRLPLPVPCIPYCDALCPSATRANTSNQAKRLGPLSFFPPPSRHSPIPDRWNHHQSSTARHQRSIKSLFPNHSRRFHHNHTPPQQPFALVNHLDTLFLVRSISLYSPSCCRRVSQGNVDPFLPHSILTDR